MRVSFAEAAGIAAVQNGRITAGQLRGCGFGNSSIENGVRAGRLHRVHKGVYALGHLAPSRLGDWHAAVLACGPGAVLSHRCAATALKIRDAVGPRIDVTIPSTSGRRRPGIAIHHCDLLACEIGTWMRIPITSPSRTMVDLAHELKDEDAIQWAMRELQYVRLWDRQLLELSNHRRPNRTIARVIDDLPPTRSPLEVAFLTRVVRRHRLPAPECQAKLEGFHVDFLWPEARLVVEVDGKNHDLPLMRQADAIRDAALDAAGYRVLRYRWADIHHHDARTARSIHGRICEYHPVAG